ncbi:MAG: hypothetical protein KIS68_14075 [Bauldia sp.]|nr:hypothetical protein [Bauldia sp.]
MTTMRVRTLVAIAVFAGATTSFGAASGQPAPDLDQCSFGPDPTRYRTGANCRHVVVDGFERDFIVNVPFPFPTEPLPLVVVLPDSGADHSLFARVNGFGGAVDDGEAIVVVPHPLPYLVPDRSGATVWVERWDPGQDIVAATPRLPAWPADAPWPADDAAYVAEVIAAVQAAIAVDPARIFVAGLGDAGRFAVRLVHARPDLFAAAGVGVVGFDLGLSPGMPRSTHPVPVFAVLGDEDADVTAEFGSDVPLDPDALLADPERFGPVLEAFGLSPPPCLATVREDGNVMTIAFCTAEGEVGFTFVLVRGVGHEAPNAINNPARYTFAPEVWRFFATVRPDL